MTTETTVHCAEHSVHEGEHCRTCRFLNGCKLTPITLADRLHVGYHGADKRYHVCLDDDELYCTTDYRDARLFVAQLKVQVATGVRR